jgi:predicted transcriptional regulator
MLFESNDMVRRSRFDHYCDVLQVIELGVEKPTRIMYKANYYPKGQECVTSRPSEFAEDHYNTINTDGRNAWTVNYLGCTPNFELAI